MKADEGVKPGGKMGIGVCPFKYMRFESLRLGLGKGSLLLVMGSGQEPMEKQNS